jgi:H+/Cl- antiporter ClcA
LLNTLFTAAVASYLSTHRSSARVTELAVAHGYDTAFWWIAGIFAGGAVICGALLRSGPLARTGSTPAQAETALSADRLLRFRCGGCLVQGERDIEHHRVGSRDAA